jgi:hypothetical protein
LFFISAAVVNVWAVTTGIVIIGGGGVDITRGTL